MIELLAELLDAPDLERALDAVAGGLHRRFACDRVAVGLVRDGELALGAVSQQGTVDGRGPEARLLLAAMEESLRAETTSLWPLSVVPSPSPSPSASASASPSGSPAPSPFPAPSPALRTLAGRRDDAVIAVVPMYRDGEAAGALLFERRGEAFAAPTLAFLERIALVLCPFLLLRGAADLGTLQRARRALRRRAIAAFGPDRPGTRAAAAAGALALVLALAVPVQHRVVSEAELVPSVRRLVTAPVAGFVEEVLVAGGERVVPGQPLARLDRRELELDSVRRDGEIRAAETAFRAAMASHDRRETAIARAALERARTLRELVGQRLERTELRAPIAGYVLGAEPLDATGAPVTAGEVLFEIAPADGHEVHLLVDESDVRDVAPGRRGTLSLRARPGDGLGFTVASVHPVAESGGGATRFRVRARLDASSVAAGTVAGTVAGTGAETGAETGAGTEAGTAVGEGTPGPRPGESGVARIDAGRTSALAALLRPFGRHAAAAWWRFFG